MATVRVLGLFPWCVFKDLEALREAYSEPSDAQWQASIKYYENFSTPLLDALALYWRVKAWRVHGAQTLILPDNEPDIIPFEFFFRRNVESEKDLICKYQLEEQEFYSPRPLIEDEGGVRYYEPSRIFLGEYPMVCDFQIPSVGVFGGVPDESPMGGHFDEADFYTHVNFSFAGNDAGGDFLGTDAGLLQFPESVEATADISFLGKTYDFSYWLARATTPFDSLTIEAIEYWPYDPGDGLGPIYDSITGAQLRASPQ
jgi:hypothetical protein